MQWNLRQVMADRGLFQTSELVPLLADRGIHVSREHVYRLVTRDPQRINVDILAALCDALACTLDDLMTPVVEETRAKTGTGGAGGSGHTGTKGEGGPTLGAIRPVRARVRRPNDQ
jgi:DNA-binding Xre family transcriptional regulator